jgi:hypothetical protein
VLTKKRSGFISIKVHNLSSAEIYVMAIKEQYPNAGIGKKLVQISIDLLTERNIKFLQVKTLSEKHPDQYYKKTRDFYYKIVFCHWKNFQVYGRAQPLSFNDQIPLINKKTFSNFNYLMFRASNDPALVKIISIIVLPSVTPKTSSFVTIFSYGLPQ